MWIFVCLSSLLVFKAQKILEYRPGVNYGQVFRDYSNNGWHAVSGLSFSADSSDVFPTDRGSYIDGTNSKLITGPSNDIPVASLTLPSTFMIAVWLMIDGDQEGIIFSRFKSSDQTKSYFYLRRIKSYSIIAFKYAVNGVTAGEIKGLKSSFDKEKWCFIALAISTSSFKVYHNGILQKTLTISTPYLESGDYKLQIGGKFNIGIGSKFFLWSFTIDSGTDQSLYYSSVQTSYCLVPDCDPCNPAVVFSSQKGCISEVLYETKTGQKKECSSKLVGCSGYPPVDLNCGCPFNSCTLSGGQHLCVCPTSAVSSTTTCSCPSGQTIRWDMCCESSCLTCSRTSADICLTCVDLNAIPHTTGCKCKDKFFNTTKLFTSSSCKACHSNCKTCTGSLLCTSCIDANAVVHQSVGCVCKEKYFNVTALTATGTCKACHNNCKTCNVDLLCTACIDVNAAIHATVGCVCKNYFFNITSLNIDGSCMKCHSDCSACSVSLICNSCIDSNATPHPKVGCICKENYYNISSLSVPGACLPCHNHCKSCSSSSQCSVCISENAIPSTSGCECKTGFYQISDFSSITACAPCYEECSKCSEYPKCQECISINAEIDSSSNCVCKSGYRKSGITLNNENSCFICHSDCNTCLEALKCEDCIAENSEPSTVQGCECKKGFYQLKDMSNFDACEVCHHHCETCLEADICLTCLDDNSQPSHQIGCICKDTFFVIESLSKDNICQSCHPHCKTCDQSDVCLTCLDLNAKPDVYGCKCLEKFYYDGLLSNEKICQECLPECSLCENGKSCSECVASNTEIINGTCLCKEGFYPRERLISSDGCLKCNYGCKQCTSGKECLKCLSFFSEFNKVGGCDCSDKEIIEIFILIFLSCDIGVYL